MRARVHRNIGMRSNAFPAGAWSWDRCFVAGGTALAASSPTYEFRIAPKSLSEALIDFAVQSNLSIGGVSACSGRSGWA